MSVTTAQNIYRIGLNLPFQIIAEGETTVTTAGTPVALVSNANAKAIRVFNNNADGTIIAVGLIATVDAMSSPMIGEVVIPYAGSRDIGVVANSNEIAVDSNTSNRKVTYHILG